MLFKLDLAALDGLAIPRRQAEIAFHRHDAGTHAPQRAGAAQDVDVIAGRLLDQFQVAPPLPDQFAHEGERPPVQETAAQGDRRAVRHQRRQLGQRALLVCLIESRTHAASSMCLSSRRPGRRRQRACR